MSRSGAAAAPAPDPRQLSAFARWGSWIVRHRRVVLLGWLVFVLAAAGPALQASHQLQGAGFDVPGSPSAKATKALGSDFHAASTTSAVVVYHSDLLRVADNAFAASPFGRSGATNTGTPCN